MQECGWVFIPALGFDAYGRLIYTEAFADNYELLELHDGLKSPL
jgi:hypothetical protein